VVSYGHGGVRPSDLVIGGLLLIDGERLRGDIQTPRLFRTPQFLDFFI
jgi:hypothetical protein